MSGTTHSFVELYSRQKQKTDPPNRFLKLTVYKCIRCECAFTHYYDMIPSFEEALLQSGIPLKCPAVIDVDMEDDEVYEEVETMIPDHGRDDLKMDGDDEDDEDEDDEGVGPMIPDRDPDDLKMDGDDEDDEDEDDEDDDEEDEKEKDEDDDEEDEDKGDEKEKDEGEDKGDEKDDDGAGSPQSVHSLSSMVYGSVYERMTLPGNWYNDISSRKRMTNNYW